MAMKYNPATNRFEVQPAGIAGLDTPPAGTVEGQFYIDQKTGQYKQRSYDTGGRIPDTVVSSITVPAAQRNQPASYAPIVPVTGAKPTVNWQPTAGQPVTKGQTVKTKGGQQTTTTTTLPKGTTTTTVPTTKTGNSKAGASAGGFRQFDQNTTAPVGEAYSQQELQLIKDYLSTIVTDPAQLNTLLAGLDGGSASGSGGSGGGSSKPTAAQTAAANKAGASKLIKAGQTAQTAYNQMGEQQASDIMKRAGEYYGGQKTTALANIDAATTDFLKNLIAPSAYANAATAQLTPEQQGLMQNLQAYGATGGQAAQQMSQDVANNQFMADLMRSSNKGLQSAEADYFNSLRNAATGGQMASRQGLENLITGLQGQAQSDADKLKRDYLLKGLEALISGQTNAANMLAGQ